MEIGTITRPIADLRPEEIGLTLAEGHELVRDIGDYDKAGVRVEFAHSSIVLDHPLYAGGTNKGPSSGYLMGAGMTAASVFCAIDAAGRLGVQLNSIVARSVWKSVREGVEESLHTLAYLTAFRLNREISGALNGNEGAHLGGRVGLFETLRDGVKLEERVTFSNGGAMRTAASLKDSDSLEHKKSLDRMRLAIGEKVDMNSSVPWKISAMPLDEDTIIIDVPGMPLCVSRSAESRRGPTPNELLLGGLAACTAIYLGRHILNDAPLQRVQVTATADILGDLSEPIRSIDKVTHLIGPLTDSEKEKCRISADYCALGVTLKRGAEMTDTIMAKEMPAASVARPSLVNFAWIAPQPPTNCDDGSCCVPVGEKLN